MNMSWWQYSSTIEYSYNNWHTIVAYKTRLDSGFVLGEYKKHSVSEVSGGKLTHVYYGANNMFMNFYYPLKCFGNVKGL